MAHYTKDRVFGLSAVEGSLLVFAGQGRLKHTDKKSRRMGVSMNIPGIKTIFCIKDKRKNNTFEKL